MDHCMAANTLPAEEEIQMKMSVVKKYLQAFGWSWVCFTVIAYVGQNAMAIGQNVWLSKWATEAKEVKDQTEWTELRDSRLGVYGVLGFVQAGFVTLKQKTSHISEKVIKRASKSIPYSKVCVSVTGPM
ncbi:unnamed protein product [Ranitomeya imitator]|uniref:Uncharacterized protein n=1 Tax=Ranitomeya imitator TaxID=111125 RepID=A0ABN9M8K1_9NEOB|nr:unnamed protein product [Ranitomeya imitator]